MRTQTITMKLKLLHNKEQSRDFLRLSESYVGALNEAGKIAFDLNKTSSNRKIHEATYSISREKYNLGSQLGCTVSRRVSATYVALWQKAKKHAHNVKTGHTKKHYRGLDQAPTFKSGTVDLLFGKDFTLKKNGIISILALNGRIKMEYRGWNQHLDMIQRGATIGGAKLCYFKPKKQWYLMVYVESTREDIDLSKIDNVKGVDVGQRNLFVSGDTKGNIQFKSGKETIHKAKKYLKLKSDLQSKGTRSAKRRLSAVGNRERRFKRDVNHKLAVQITTKNTLIGMEDLTGIAENTMRKRHKAKWASPKQREANRQSSTWAYAELRTFVQYKSFFQNSIFVPVNPFNTSKKCSKCGHVSDDNRPNGAVVFRCVACKHEAHSDKNAVDNILNLTISERQRLSDMGCLSTTPMHKAKSMQSGVGSVQTHNLQVSG